MIEIGGFGLDSDGLPITVYEWTVQTNYILILKQRLTITIENDDSELARLD